MLPSNGIGESSSSFFLAGGFDTVARHAPRKCTLADRTKTSSGASACASSVEGSPSLPGRASISKTSRISSFGQEVERLPKREVLVHLSEGPAPLPSGHPTSRTSRCGSSPGPPPPRKRLSLSSTLHSQLRTTEATREAKESSSSK